MLDIVCFGLKSRYGHARVGVHIVLSLSRHHHIP